MIKITKGTDTKVVTKGAYENFYKNMGYVTVGKNVTAKVKDVSFSDKTTETTTLKDKESNKQN